MIHWLHPNLVIQLSFLAFCPPRRQLHLSEMSLGLLIFQYYFVQLSNAKLDLITAVTYVIIADLISFCEVGSDLLFHYFGSPFI